MKSIPHSTTLAERYPYRAIGWNLRTRKLRFDRLPKLMGILNITPDSFSDGGKWMDQNAAIDQALQMEADGASIIDIGGESTRPYSQSVSTDEELRRVLPIVEAIQNAVHVPLSIDTTKAAVAKEAIAAGVEIINDISGLEADPEMVPLAVESGAGVCAMHMQGTPQTMQDDPQYDDVVLDIFDYLQARYRQLRYAGIDRTKICLDPGIGFGKSHQHNFDLMAKCDEFHTLGCPILVGHSRKGFLAKTLGDKDMDRTLATVGASLTLARLGVQIIRVHDVRANMEALEAFVSTGGIDGVAMELPDDPIR
ncbi:dihydropteroate synthase [Bremerella cremea]|uniref:Dihydropteroate synthase n=1 Tax=Blastopirellula marina TaxID=124 RepID=A0A2S8FAZ3_9BACT|nr:dihydropteroate synthase [Blastopirellula marina]PQO29321.1 dihydropteroate synthase [Blastopirellula marina]RCS42625.1 dihydropteroate synthase [Bremerella cremea]